MHSILDILLVALVVIAIDLAHYQGRVRSNKPGVGPSSLRIATVTTAIIAAVIGAAVLFYLNAA